MEIGLPTAGLGEEDASSTWQQAALTSCTGGRVKEQHHCATLCLLYCSHNTVPVLWHDAEGCCSCKMEHWAQSRAGQSEGKRKVWQHYTHKWAFAALGSAFSLLPTLGRRSFHPGGAEHPTSESTLWDTEPSENCSKHSLSHRHPGWTFHLERTGTQGQLRLSWKEQVTLNLVLPTGLNPSYR